MSLSSMYARQAFKAVQPLKQTVRRYATPPGPASSGSSTALYGTLGAAALGGGGYYYYNRTMSTMTTTTPPSAIAPASTHEQNAVPAKTSSSPNHAFTGGEQGFLDLKLESVETVNHNTKKFRFALPDPDDVSGLMVTSALITKYMGPGMEKPVIRPYTPTNDEDEKGYVELIIKKYPGGPMSEHMHNMEVNQRLSFKGPVPKYIWTPNKHEHVALIAGGTGITPCYQLARTIFKNPDDKTKVTLIFGNTTEEDILLKKELEDLENTYPNRFRAFYLLTKPPAGWAQGTGQINKELLKTVLPEPKEDNFKIFVCGPPGMYKALSGVKKGPQDQGVFEGTLKDMGYSQDQVYKF